MKHLGSLRIKSLILALILTVQAICLCCVFAACTSAGASTSLIADKPAAAASVTKSGGTPADNYSRWLSRHYSAEVVTRARWLRDMMTSLGLLSENAARDDAALFVAAHGAGFVDSPDADCYTALTRADVAADLYAAMGYSPRTAGALADAADDDDAMHTIVYYGWLLPDDEDRVYPDAAVTESEYQSLTAQLRRCAVFKGRHILAFGDSIMYGSGNNGDGLADMIAEKYAMTVTDYSVAGAHFGIYRKTSHIPAQIEDAIKAGDKGDIILLNGSTNDMLHTDYGETDEGFDLLRFEDKTFSGGMQTALALLRAYRGDTPVLYIRAHNMRVCDDAVERKYGEHAIGIAGKWSVASVDLYEDSGFNAEDPLIMNRYTRYKESLGRGDSAHPTALGYATFYLPPVEAKMEALLDHKGMITL